MIQQQRTGLGLVPTARSLFSTHGPRLFYKGLFPTMVRESLFTCGYLGAGPVLKGTLLSAFPDAFEGRPMLAALLASVLAGQMAALLTQPFDTLKTRMQGDIGDKAKGIPAKYTGTVSGMAKMWEEGGAKTLFAGIVPRAIRMTCAVFVLGFANEWLTEAIIARDP